MKTLTPYLSFQGTCEAALAHYAEAFGGRITELKRFGDAPAGASKHPNKEHVMHARFEADGIRLMASDGRDKNAVNPADPQITLSLEISDRDEQQRVFDKLADGGKVTMPLADQFWGFGMVVDKFGVLWMLNSENKK
jgi:PhnB protein